MGGTPEQLERDGWRALSGAGEDPAAFYDRVLADEVVFLLPGGMRLTDRATVLASMAGPPWDAHTIEDLAVVAAGADAALVHYGVTATRAGTDYTALVSSVYAHVDGTWRLVAHQQTPRP